MYSRFGFIVWIHVCWTPCRGSFVYVFIVLMFFLFDKLLIFVPSFMAGVIQYLSVDYHISNMSRGVIDTRNVIYFISVIGMFLFLTVQALSSRKWK